MEAKEAARRPVPDRTRGLQGHLGPGPAGGRRPRPGAASLLRELYMLWERQQWLTQDLDFTATARLA